MKIKSIAAALLAASVIIGQMPITNAAFSEEIKLNVAALDPVDYDETNQQFTMLDLREFANRDFTDDVAGDGTGGWSDQGDNDMRMFPYRGNVKFENIPFQIINPGSNNRKAVVGVRGQNDRELPTRVDVPVNQTAAGVYFIHSSPYGYGTCGRYEFVYEDGSTAYLNLTAGVHINDFWDGNSQENYRIVYSGENAKTKTASLGLFALNNPHPEKVIKSIGIQTSGSGAYIMVVAMTLTDKGPYLPSRVDETLNPNRRHWVAYNAPDENALKGSILDFSYRLDAPAGRHGAVTVKDDGFIFADGTEAKFWGTNLKGSACFPEASEAEKIADTLARCGISLVRMSGLDEVIFGENDYGELSKPMADKLCVLIDKLKERGIYTYLAPISDSRFKISGFFNSEQKDLQKKYLKNLLTYNNIGNDPAVAMMELLPSNSMYDISAVFAKSDFLPELNTLYNEFIKAKYGNDSALKRAYRDGYGTHSDESIAKGTMRLNLGWRTEVLSKRQLADVCEFMTYIQNDYSIEMDSFIKSLGFKTAVSGCSNTRNNLYAGDYSGEFAAKNVMWDTAAVPHDYLAVNDLTGSRTAISADKNAGYFGILSAMRFFGMPFVISEYGTAQINPYQAEPIVMMAAIAGQQGWTPLQYAYAAGGSLSSGKLSDYYSMNNDPVRLAVTAACSEIFAGMEKAETKVQRTENISQSSALPASERLNCRYGLSLTDGRVYSADVALKPVIKNSGIYLDTNNGFFAAQTKSASAVTLSKKTSVKLTHFSYIPENNQSTLVLTGAEGKDIKDSDRLLLTAAGRSMNSKMSLEVHRQITNVGEAPVMAEPLSGRFTLRLNGNFKVYALNFNGERISKIPVTKRSNESTFKLSGDNGCIYYEIVREVQK